MSLCQAQPQCPQCFLLVAGWWLLRLSLPVLANIFLQRAEQVGIFTPPGKCWLLTEKGWFFSVVIFSFFFFFHLALEFLAFYFYFWQNLNAASVLSRGWFSLVRFCSCSSLWSRAGSFVCWQGWQSWCEIRVLSKTRSEHDVGNVKLIPYLETLLPQLPQL